MPPKKQTKQAATKAAAAPAAAPAPAPAPVITEPLCDMDDPILRQAVLPRLKESMDLITILAPVSPKALVVALANQDASSEEYVSDREAEQLFWMLKRNYLGTKLPHLATEIQVLCSRRDKLIPVVHRLPGLRVLRISSWDGSRQITPKDVRLWREHLVHLEGLDVKLEAEEDEDYDPMFAGDDWAEAALEFWAEILKMKNLKHLRFESRSLLALSVPALGKLSKLESLTLINERDCSGEFGEMDDGYSGAQNLDVETFQNLSHLTRLELHSMNFTSDAAKALPRLTPALREIKICTSMHDDYLTEDELAAWSEGLSLRRLELSCDFMSRAVLKKIGDFGTLEHLKIDVSTTDSNEMNAMMGGRMEDIGEDPKFFPLPAFGSKMVHLKTLRITSYSRRSFMPLSHLVGLTELTSLDLEVPMKLGDVKIEQLPEALPSLQSLKWASLQPGQKQKLKKAFASRAGFKLEAYTR